MRVRQINLRKLWLSLLLLVGATAIAIPGIQEVAADGDVAEVNGTGYATLQEAFNAATDGQTITLLGDITQDDGFKFDRSNVSAKLDLNSHTLTVNNGSSVNNRAIRIDNGTLEVYGGSIVAVGSGTTSSNGTGCYGAFRVEANGKLIAHDLTLSNARPWGLNVKVLGGEAELTNVTINSSYGGGIEVTEANLGAQSKKGKATLTNCNFTQEYYFDHCSTAISVSGGSEVVVNSGSYIGEYALYVFSSGGVITINGGTFEGRGNNNRAAFISMIDTNTYPTYTGGMQLNDGTFKGKFDITSPSYAVVKGGTYTTDPTPYLAEGLKAVQNNGTWTVQEKYVAQIGETKYETLAEAVAAVHSGETILLLDNLENIGSVSLPAGVTLDGDGKNITGNSAIKINVNGGTVQNVNFKNIHNSINQLSAIYGTNLAGTATITGCSFDNCDWDAIQITPVAGANVVITNNTFSDDESDGVKQQRYIHVQSKTNVDFSATITENVMPGKLTQEPLGVYYPTDKSKVDLKNNYTESINDVCILVADNNGYAGELVFPAYTTAEKQETYSPVAMIQNGSYAANFYAKLQDAINAGEGKTVKLLAGIDLGSGYANITKAVTIEGDGHTITSTAKQAIAISGSGNVTINNTVISAANRGINVLDVSTGFTLNVNNSTIQSQVDDPTKTYTIGEDSRGINVANADGVTVNITNSTIQGFSYDINIPASGTNLTVNVTGGKTYGRDIVNNWGSNNTFNLNGVEVHGLNNQTGPTEAFSCIVDNAGCQNNNYIIQDCQFIATLSDAAMAAEGSSATEEMIDLRGTNSIVTVKGNTTYTINEGAETRGGIVTTEVYLMPNKGNIVRFDDTAKQNFVSWAEKMDAFDFVDKDNDNYWPLTFVAQIQLVYPEGGKYYGKYLKTIKSAFEDEKYGDKTQITLLKDITLDENLTCPLTDGQYFIMNMSDYSVAKGDCSIALVPGTTVYSTKKTDIFSSANADFKVVETEEDGGFAYTVVAKEYVAQIGEGENAKKYETLEAAIEAATAGQTITLLANIDTEAQVEVGKQVTLDLNGKTIEYKGTTELQSGVLMVLRGGDLTLKDTSEGATGAIKSGTKAYAAIILTKLGETSTETAKLTVNGGTLEGYYYAITGNGNRHGTEITINGGVLKGTAENDNLGIFHPQDGTLTITGGTITGYSSGVEMRSGTLNVTGGTITATADSYSYSGNGNGNTTTGAAIAIAQHNTGKDITANITGTTLSGTKLISVVDTQNNDLGNVTVTASDNYIENTAIPADFKWVAAQTEGMSTLTKKTYVAQIGDDKYESLAAAVAAVPADGTEATTIKMIANEMINVVGSAITIPTNKNVVIDLNGFQVVGTAEGGSTSALITNKGTLTIKDSSDTNKDGTGTGKLISGATTTWIYDGGDDYSGSYASNTISNGGTLTIESGYVENLSTGSATYAVDNNSNGVDAILNIKGGLLTAKGTVVRQFCNSTTKQNVINMTGGVVTTNGSTAIWTQLPGSNASSKKLATLNISGGEITARSNAWYDYSFGDSFEAVEYSVSGGKFKGDMYSYAVDGGVKPGFITGGVFASTTYEYNGNTYDCDWLSMLAEGYIPTANTDEATKAEYPYAVKQGAFIAAIGDVKYETLQDAINACEAGTETTIKLLDNVTDGAGFAIPDRVTNKNIIIDFNGKSYNVTKGGVGSTGTPTQAMHFYSGNTLTLKNGTITSAATSEENKLKMMMQNYCDLTLDGMTIDCSNVNGGTYGTFTGADAYWSNKSVPVFNFNTGNATIKNTTITFREGDNMGLCVDGGTVALGEGVEVNGPVSAVTGTVTITDGKYSGAVTADQATLKISGGIFAVKPADEYCAEGYVVVDNEDEETSGTYHYAVKTKEDAGIYDLFDSTIPDKYKAYEDYGVTENKNVKSVTYTRKFTSSDVTFYRPWYIPFDYKITEADTENFVFFRISMIAGSERSGEVDKNNNDIILFIKSMEVNEVLKANRPYILRPKVATGEYVFKAENTMLYAPESTSRKHLETSEFKYDFYGNYVKDYPCGPDYSMYYLGSRNGFSPNRSTSKLQSYRWYVTVESNDINADAKPVFEFVEEDGEATGINNTNAEYTDEIEGIYNSNGIRLESKTKGLNIIKYKSGKTKKIYIK